MYVWVTNQCRVNRWPQCKPGACVTGSSHMSRGTYWGIHFGCYISRSAAARTRLAALSRWAPRVHVASPTHLGLQCTGNECEHVSTLLAHELCMGCSAPMRLWAKGSLIWRQAMQPGAPGAPCEVITGLLWAWLNTARVLIFLLSASERSFIGFQRWV